MNAPVVIVLYGHNSSHSKLIGLTDDIAPYEPWLAISEQENVILAVLNGLFISEDEKGWNDCRSDAPTNSNADDVLFVSALIDFIVDRYEVDIDRV